jgi:putative endonuclease
MRKEHNYWVYIVTNPDREVMYTGVTNDLARRLNEHYNNKGDDKTFAGRYFCYNLVYYEHYKYILNAIAREKEIKDQSRAKKLKMVSEFNPTWKFLNADFIEGWTSDFEISKPLNQTAGIPNWWEGLIPPP